VSTDLVGRFALDEAWMLHPQVAVRPERFGALLYHFGNRRLSFLKDPALVELVTALTSHESARNAMVSIGVVPDDLAGYVAALSSLAEKDVIRPRGER
jgi:putative mycofactocin binding protein MftB